MIVRQRAPAEILGALGRYLQQMETEFPVAFFLIEGDKWMLAAKDELDPRTEAALARIDPGIISDRLFALGPGAQARLEQPCGASWARHFSSGAGELLGMIVGLGDSSMLPSGLYATRIESACRLATLAVEQTNLVRELAFKSDGNSFARSLSLSHESETLTQQFAQMIARECPSAEILGALCKHLGLGQTEHQVAFFLLDNENWTLAARGDLTPEAEAALARIHPPSLSDTLFGSESAMDGPREGTFDAGWARHLYSGTGELLGMIVGLCQGPMLPTGQYSTRVESVCGLATLALEHRNLMDELAFKADHDPLTKLFNRAYYERALGSMLRQNKRTDTCTALLCANLDRFRLVNDVLGSAIGNLLLEAVGQRFRMCLREGNVVSRVGGDEFAILLPDLTANSDAGAVADRLLRSLSSPFSIEGHELFLNASIGIGCSTAESTPQSLEREAYLALHQAKRAGKARSMHFHLAMAATPPERLEMEKRLRFALQRRELLLYYQPQIELRSGLVPGAEALLRWRPEGLGVVSPAAFIPILEETGLIVEVGTWVLGEACRQGKEWIDKSGIRMRIGVNVSALQFTQPDFVDCVERAVTESGFPRELLELELTESLFVGDFESARRVFEKLQSTGITLALDDFGTGQSSLSYLDKLPFQRLKIDQSFIRGIRNEGACPPLVPNIIHIAASLGMSTIAEGVETPHQAELLQSLGCEEGQGFLFARPMPPEGFADFCQTHPANKRP